MAISPRIIRAGQLALVTVFAFGLPILSSVQIALSPSASGETGRQVSSAAVIFTLAFETLAIALLLYILFRREGGIQQLGVSIRWKDVPVSLAIAIAGYLTFYVLYLAIYYGYPLITHKELVDRNALNLLSGGITAWAIALVLLNPFYEELIVRAYFISEVQFLTGSRALAVAFSAGIQTLYHLYQGFNIAAAMAGVFLLFSVYYLKSRRIVPVILAHMYFDAVALWFQSRP